MKLREALARLGNVWLTSRDAVRDLHAGKITQADVESRIRHSLGIHCPECETRLYFLIATLGQELTVRGSPPGTWDEALEAVALLRRQYEFLRDHKRGLQ